MSRPKLAGNDGDYVLVRHKVARIRELRRNGQVIDALTAEHSLFQAILELLASGTWMGDYCCELARAATLDDYEGEED